MVRMPVLAGLALALLLAPPRMAPAADAPPRVAVLLDIAGPIGPATTHYVARGLEAARERQAALVVLRMDTPGGLAAAMRDIVQAILAAPMPVIGYVAPSGARAASAGTYILYACHLAAMAPGTNLGAATPIQIGSPSPFGGSPEGKDEKGESKDPAAAKAVNDAAAYIRALAELRGRNADWAEKAVREAASLSAAAAEKEGVIDFVAADLSELLAKADGRSVTLAGEARRLATRDLAIVEIAPDWRIRLLGIVTDPNIALLLLTIGIYGIIFEFMSPGVVFPGVIGAICLLVGLFALNLLPIDYTGFALLLLGIAFMTAEAFFPSFGALGVGGAVAFVAGALMMFDVEAPGFALSPALVILVAGASFAFLSVLLVMALRARRRRVVTGPEGLIGSVGRVLEWSGGRGQIHVHGERWQARADRALAPGQRVTVTGREAFTLTVEPAPEASQGSAPWR